MQDDRRCMGHFSICDGVSEGRKRVIRKKATKFMISDDGIMLYKHKKKQKVTCTGVYVPICLEE